MNAATTSTEQATDWVYTTYIATTPEQLWQALTDRTFTERYWGVALTSDWQAGSPVTWEFAGVTIAEPAQTVLAADRPRRLSYTWHVITPEFIGGDRRRRGRVDAMAAEPLSHVTFDLEPAGSMVKLTVTHGGFQPGSAVLAGVSQGWPSILSQPQDAARDGRSPAGGAEPAVRDVPEYRMRARPSSGTRVTRDTRVDRRRTAYVPDRPEATCQRSCWGACRSPSPRTTARSPRTVSDFLVKHQSRAAARALLETADEPNASFYKEAADLGWLGLHVPEELGGSGYGLEETVVVAEELGRALAPGAFVPTLIASAVLVAAGTDDVKARLLPGLADGSTLGAAALGGDVDGQRREAAPARPARCSAPGSPTCILVPVGDDVAVVDAKGAGVTVEMPKNLDTDPARRAASRSTARPATSSPAPAGRSSTSPARSSPPKPSASPARAPTSPPSTPRCACSSAARSPCTRASSTTAPTWPSRPSWPRPRCGTPPVAARRRGGDQFTYAAAVAAALAGPAANLCVNLGMQVHGGIGYTWEHDCHVYMRRATALARRARRRRRRDRRRRPDPRRRQARPHRRPAAGGGVDPQRRAGVRRRRSRASTSKAVTAKLIESGYAMPHWPKPYGLRGRLRRAARDRAGVRQGRRQATAARHHRLGHPDDDPARHARAGVALGRPGARPGRHLVPAVLRARRRVGRRRHQDQGHARRRRLAGQRAEGVDERRQGVVVRPGNDPHRTRTCPSTRASRRWSST